MNIRHIGAGYIRRNGATLNRHFRDSNGVHECGIFVFLQPMSLDKTLRRSSWRGLEAVLFTSSFRPVLDSFATSLINNAGTQVTIIGYTDSSGSDVVNNPLSLDRAISTRDYLVNRVFL